MLPENENRVCKLVKLLYGLKQTPKQWYDKFESILLSHEFRSNNANKCIYSKFNDKNRVIICFYVNDMLIVGTNYQAVVDTKKYLSSNFKNEKSWRGEYYLRD